MAWIESHVGLNAHPKVFRLSVLIKKNKNETIGLLHRFWWWCLEYVETGDLQKFSKPEIDAAMGVEAFADGLEKAGFIDKEPFRVHDWLDFSGRYLTGKYRTQNPKKLKQIFKFYDGNSQSDFRQTKDGQPYLTIPNHTRPDLTIPTELAELLIVKIKINNPSAILPKTTTAWAQDIEKLHRLDKQDYGLIRRVLEWCQSDSFWKSNILSGGKLRKQWNKLTAKMNSGGNHGISQRVVGGAAPQAGKYKEISGGS